MSNALWLEYRPDKLFFYGGRNVTFSPKARMLYNETDHVIMIEAPGAVVDNILRDMAKTGAELRRIEYSMLVNLPKHRETLTFFHEVERGAGLRIRTNDRGDIFFMQDKGAPLFSKDYSLRSITDGEIPSDRAVWQFHGYRHEH